MERHPSRREPKRLAADELWEYAVKSLGARAQSAGEVRAKLTRKAESVADVEEIIRRLREYGYLNDTRFAESYAGARLENQGLGKSRVLRDLRQRKISSAVAATTIDRVYKEVDEMDLIASFLKRKVRTKGPLAEALEDPKQLASIYRKLVRAGFSSPNAILALKRIAKNQDLLDGFEAPEEEESSPDAPAR